MLRNLTILITIILTLYLIANETLLRGRDTQTTATTTKITTNNNNNMSEFNNNDDNNSAAASPPPPPPADDDDKNVNKNAMNPNSERKFEIMAWNRAYFGFGYDDSRDWDGSFTFIQATDTQFGLQERVIEKIPDYGWSKEIRWTREMVEEINAMVPRPKFVVVTGDLVDAQPRPQNASIREQQIRDLKRELANLDVPLVCLPGNHDVDDTPTSRTVGEYTRTFGDDYFSFQTGGVYFLGLNSQLLKDDSMSENLSADQEAWLDIEIERIAEAKPTHAVVLMHIPPFVNTPTEPDMYFNLPTPTRSRLLEKFKWAGIKYVFCGHVHKNAGGFYEGVSVVVTSAVGAQFGGDRNGYRVVSVHEDRIQHYYKELESTK